MPTTLDMRGLPRMSQRTGQPDLRARSARCLGTGPVNASTPYGRIGAGRYGGAGGLPG
ncbi:MAG TPA: hypothetical protein VN520_26295 [Streptomyces sp.]|uniref:hypothetical protein n=1 Tax=Streptomyces sp. TaxID=1931 RepID=UPI002C2A69DD|nr:hypothetical protein [Streptomyces sp.]HWU09843.1 hypothetical protein [Streptomyces sp.]